jgi:hypothetical protein
MMGKAVEQRCGHLGITEHAGPVDEAEVGGYDDAGALVELAEQVEEQRAARRAERQVAATAVRSSPCRRAKPICSSVNFDVFISKIPCFGS